MQQSLEREIRAIHAWAKLAPGTQKTVDGDATNVDYTLVVDGVKLAVVITLKQGVLTARELAILDNYKSGGIWKFAYVLNIENNEIQWQELSKLRGSFKGTTLTPDTTTFKWNTYE